MEGEKACKNTNNILSMNNIFQDMQISEELDQKRQCNSSIGRCISANSWFSPYKNNQKYQKHSYASITDDPKDIIQRRSHSAGSILGRRHFEIDKQNIDKEEIIYGRNIYEYKDVDLDKQKDCNSVRGYKGRFCGKSTPVTFCKLRTSLLSSQRPHTSGTDADRNEVNLDLVCYQMRAAPEELRTCTPKSVSNATTITDFKRPYTSRDTSALSLKSNCVLNSKMKPEHEEQTSTPLYWKTRTEFHKRQIAYKDGFDFEVDTNYVSKGSLLKPLMFKKGSNFKHSAGCPYKCKGCFRACLASGDYLEKLLQRKRQNQHKTCKIIKPKFYYRRIIERALAESQPIHHKILENKETKTVIDKITNTTSKNNI